MLKPGLVRFILALLVVFYHITKVAFFGSFAVSCFFILSGYWVSVMFDSKYSKMDNSIAVFYISRIWRLLPVFLLFSFLATCACIVFKPNFIVDFEGLSFLEKNGVFFSYLFILGYNILPVKALGPAWSLDIEVQFYILFPFIFWLTKKKAAFNMLLLLSFVGTIILPFFYDVSIVSRTLLGYLLYFVVGIYIYKNNISFSNRNELIGVVLFMILVLVNYVHPYLRNIVLHVSHPDYIQYFNAFITFLLIPFFCNSVRRKSEGVDRVLGDMSYVLYLSHWVWIIPYNHFIDDLTKLQRIPFLIFYLVFTIVASFLFYKYFDLPIDHLRKRWVAIRYNKLNDKPGTESCKKNQEVVISEVSS